MGNVNLPLKELKRTRKCIVSSESSLKAPGPGSYPKISKQGIFNKLDYERGAKNKTLRFMGVNCFRG